MLTLAGKEINSLEEFVSQVKIAHERVNSHRALDFYDTMAVLLKECKTYRELGTKEGASAAVAAVAGIKNLHLIDIDMSLFMKRKDLFKDVELVVDQRSSTNYKTSDLSEVDFLLIDSLHNAAHIKQELQIHAPKVNKYILAHDTNSIPSMHNVMMDYIDNNKQWELMEYHQVDVGYTVLKRK